MSGYDLSAALLRAGNLFNMRKEPPTDGHTTTGRFLKKDILTPQKETAQQFLRRRASETGGRSPRFVPAN
jgi:hypothetical protein